MVFENVYVQILIRLVTIAIVIWLFLISINQYFNFENWQLACLFFFLLALIYVRYKKNFDAKEMIV